MRESRERQLSEELARTKIAREREMGEEMQRARSSMERRIADEIKQVGGWRYARDRIVFPQAIPCFPSSFRSSPA